MLNVFQINDAIDSIQKEADKTSLNFINSIKLQHPYFQAINLKIDTIITNQNIEQFKSINEKIKLDEQNVCA